MAQTEILVNKIFDTDISFYEQAIYHLKIPFLLLDRTGKIVYANRAALLVTGYSEAELLDKSFSELFPAEDGNSFDMVKANEKLEAKTTFMHQEGAMIDANIKVFGYPYDERRAHYYQVILKDMYLDPIEAAELRRPLDTLTDVMRKTNDKLEQTLKELKKRGK